MNLQKVHICPLDIFSQTIYNTTIQFRCSEEVNSLNLNKLLPLTETTFYIMLSLVKPSHGYVVMQTVEELSAGRVRVAAGTMYGAVENLLKHKLIVEIPNDDKRRRVYALTRDGQELLRLESERLRYMAEVSEQTLSKRGNQDEKI
jgi:DNA-binding PadR family transcriptional regulator